VADASRTDQGGHPGDNPRRQVTTKKYRAREPSGFEIVRPRRWKNPNHVENGIAFPTFAKGNSLGGPTFSRGPHGSEILTMPPPVVAAYVSAYPAFL
jgi:hypothetical protein